MPSYLDLQLKDATEAISKQFYSVTTARVSDTSREQKFWSPCVQQAPPRNPGSCHAVRWDPRELSLPVAPPLHFPGRESLGKTPVSGELCKLKKAEPVSALLNPAENELVHFSLFLLFMA